jgi:hypothetical protein
VGNYPTSIGNPASAQATTPPSRLKAFSQPRCEAAAAAVTLPKPAVRVPEQEPERHVARAGDVPLGPLVRFPDVHQIHVVVGQKVDRLLGRDAKHRHGAHP